MIDYEYESKILPFDNELALPQRLRFVHNNEVLEVEYRRNSHDGSVYIKIRKLEGFKLLYIGRLVEGGAHYVKDKDSGVYKFILFVRELSSDNIEIMLIDETFKLEEYE